MRRRKWHGSARPKNRGNRAIAWILMLCIALSSGVLYVNTKIRPLMREYASARIHHIATTVLNEAISDELEQRPELYSDLVHFEKDANGEITALKTDIIKINMLKSAIITSVSKRLAAIQNSDIGIPLGNIVNGELLTGRGPIIKLRIIPYGSAIATFASVFSSAGINQTRHQIIVEATVIITAILPGTSVSREVKAQVSIAETVLIGTVPDSYTYIDDTRSQTLDKVNDYAGQ